jgi:hypothetical protein
MATTRLITVPATMPTNSRRRLKQAISKCRHNPTPRKPTRLDHTLTLGKYRQHHPRLRQDTTRPSTRARLTHIHRRESHTHAYMHAHYNYGGRIAPWPWAQMRTAPSALTVRPSAGARHPPGKATLVNPLPGAPAKPQWPRTALRQHAWLSVHEF